MPPPKELPVVTPGVPDRILSAVAFPIVLPVIVNEAARVTPVLRLYTFARNLGARRFYERHGFSTFDEMRLGGEGPPLWLMLRRAVR